MDNAVTFQEWAQGCQNGLVRQPEAPSAVTHLLGKCAMKNVKILFCKILKLSFHKMVIRCR